MSTVSVIVPIYNAESYLAQCLDSLICQTHRQLQIILIDDGSTDGSFDLALRYSMQDARIELYSQDNQGQAAARNRGLRHVHGDYVSFVDADDYLALDFYATLLSAIGDADCVQIGYQRVNPEGQVLQHKQPKRFHQFTVPWARLYRRSLIADHHLRFPEGMIYEDVVFSLDLWAAKPSYVLLPYAGYYYMLNTQSTTSQRRPQQRRQLFRALRERRRQATSLCQWFTVVYTSIRLIFHFLRYD